jgi:hypothetical protein
LLICSMLLTFFFSLLQSVSDNDVRNIVLSYLMHNCFKETAETFLSSTGLKLPVDYSVNVDKRKGIYLQVNTKSCLHYWCLLFVILHAEALMVCFEKVTRMFLWSNCRDTTILNFIWKHSINST